ncbi:hypothetical protein AMAG_11373 [Allomyces macrogynus ATCC 38327]|uniref:Uncharacterized protein n=1 Tax=Allomyces macrogynus (strain ATCC 38327) TaxID=578462 RepID=A0A0L0SWL3_ALLM3|nr:hypothetical protein AMAG_11373 [Allomyces macrogynus ATCC 38327]|eukprot:KNE66897.1 hypothetical protein AMAG_11373 [Allomyces macrogynus ATCC 38327]
MTVPGASGCDSDGSDDGTNDGTDSDMSLANNVLDNEDAGSELEGFFASDAEDADVEGASAAAIPLAFRNLSEMDWFMLFIRFLIRVVVAPKVANALRRNREHPLTEGLYKVLEQIQSREQVMQSTVWSAELKEALETYLQAKETSDPIMTAAIMLGIGVEDEDDEDGSIVEEFRRFERMLEDADDTLSNRVGALKRTCRGGGAERWGR